MLKKTHREVRMKIILIGFMGSGKSTVSRLLAEALRLEQYEMDDLIVARTPYSSPREIFDREGEAAFRSYEKEVAAQCGARTSGVISTGGGVITASDNISSLKQNGGTIVFLETTFETIARRVAHDTPRPLFKEPESARALFDARIKLYREAADITVTTDAKSAEEVTHDIIAQLMPHISDALSDTTRKHALVIGDPISHSLSPEMHTAGYAALGVEHLHTFSRLRVLPDELAACITCAKYASRLHASISGISVTLPHKEQVIPLLDSCSEEARAIGAVNTVIFDNGKASGYNTDVAGIIEPLRKRCSLAGAHVAVIGAGGAARAATYGARNAGAQVTIYNRDVKRAERLAHEFGVAFQPLSGLKSLHHVSCIIQATSVGMHPHHDALPFAPELIEPHHIVFDLIYRPLRTKLLDEAHKRGATTIEGLEMFITQGAAQFKLYTGIDAPYEILYSTVQRLLTTKAP
jgi:shikimate dehydrogenase